MKKVLINGADGKMGAMVAEIIGQNPDYGLQVSARREAGQNAAGGFDIVIDFSSPEGAAEAYETAKKNKAALLVGTTNLPSEFIAKLKAEKNIPVFFSPNVSIGVYLFTELLKTAQNLYKGYERRLEEIHHIHKKDAPSGTAKALAAALNFPPEEIKSVREGEVPGTHTFILSSEYEEITLSHAAKTRRLFAESAVIIAAWLVTQKPGFYDMRNFVERK